ncbi:protein of unknown function [Geodermatophilus obscurus]|uniref:eCIS core domain-containing protein n=1 Tax=Geodermatophilus obscurus TaxID=1861 RepID=A0A1I5HPK4_9ACTN|nr:DUF4157 domain-containing protein [Geodermatophilus obscurus]SFO50193.1 protein of unknown function [Geodermatophilus obscurus]
MSRAAVRERASGPSAARDGGHRPAPHHRGSAPTHGLTPVPRLAVQRLSVSEPHDSLEVEAGAAARRIVGGQRAGPVSAVGGGPQRVAVGEDEEVQRVAVGEDEEIQRVAVGEEPTEDDGTVHGLVSRLAAGRPAMTPGVSAALRSPTGGSPIPGTIRSTIEPRLGVDLGGVQVHDGPEAQGTASRLQARALTHGNHIFLGRGESPHDLSLMAHEATHVVQQGAIGPAAGGSGDGAVQRLPAVVSDGLADYANYVPGYRLLTVLIGYDPLADAPVERSAVNLVGGLMALTPLGNLVLEKLSELGILEDAFALVDRQLATFDLSLERLEQLVTEAWDEMDFLRLDPFEYNLGVLTGKLATLVADVTGFGTSVLGPLLDLVKDAALDVVEPLLEADPAWSLMTSVLRQDPLRGEPVEATTVEILDDFLRLIGRETELQQMREKGTLQETADWIDTQLATFTGLLTQFESLFASAWEAIQPENLPDLMPSLQALAGRVVDLLRQAWDFAVTVAAKVLELVKTALLGQLSTFAQQVPGFPLLAVVLGRDPFTGAEVPRSATNIIRGFITLLPGGNATFDQLAETGVIEQAAASIEGAMSELGITWEMATGLFLGIWNSLSIDDLVDPISAFERIRDQFGEPIARLFAFVRVVLREVFTLLLALMNFPTDVVVRIVTNAMAAFEDITRDPVGFLLNMLAAVREGFTRFFGGIVDHLLGGLTDWLFRGVRQAGIEPPTELTLESALDLLLQVLGITEDRLWEKLAERIGQERVDQIRGAIEELTGIWTFVRDVEERGVVAIWEYVQGQLSNLWDVIISAARDWIMQKIVIKVTTWLLSFLDPTFIMTVINGFIVLFNAINSAIEYAREMLDIVDLYVGTMASVARGDIEPGAAMMEQGLVSAIPVAIGFLAYQVGLGNIGDKIAEIVGGLRDMVDKALDWLLDQAERMLQSVLGLLGAGGADEAAAASQAPPADLDPTDHEAVATQVVQDLEQESDAADYASLRAAKEAQARTIEATYTPMLEPGIALTIIFAEPVTDLTDEDVDFDVVIAPNTKRKKGAAKFRPEARLVGGELVIDRIGEETKTFTVGDEVQIFGKGPKKPVFCITGFASQTAGNTTYLEVKVKVVEYPTTAFPMGSPFSFAAVAYGCTGGWSEPVESVRPLPREVFDVEINRPFDHVWGYGRDETARKVAVHILNYRAHGLESYNPTDKEWEHIAEEGTGGAHSAANMALADNTVNADLNKYYQRVVTHRRLALLATPVYEPRALRDVIEEQRWSLEMQREYKLWVYQNELRPSRRLTRHTSKYGPGEYQKLE